MLVCRVFFAKISFFEMPFEENKLGGWDFSGMFVQALNVCAFDGFSMCLFSRMFRVCCVILSWIVIRSIHK